MGYTASPIITPILIIAAYEAAVRLVPDGHQYQAELLGQLGLLLRRVEYFGDVADIDNAIFALEGSLILTPDGHADKPNYLNNLGNLFAHRSECSGDLADSDRAISTHERAVNLTPDGHADKPGKQPRQFIFGPLRAFWWPG
jgi:tetratricopeptide (TPR) repeat protein